MQTPAFPPPLNARLQSMDRYQAKAISLAASNDPALLNLSVCEPAFGPPDACLDGIEREDLSLAAFLDGAKRQEDSRGNPALRQAIADWYARRYGLAVDPEREILVTHGGIEAMTLAVLATTEAGDRVALSDPALARYAQAVEVLGRRGERIARSLGGDEFAAAAALPDGVRALIVNSPENPTGYVASATDWTVLGHEAAARRCWVIHDERYDTMAFERPHRPAALEPALAPNAVLVNSLSKKFGLPGLRVGWLAAPAALIEQAAKAHDYLYLGVNPQYQRIAIRLLDRRHDSWLDDMAGMMAERAWIARQTLTEELGFQWPRQPLGGMFLFPEVSRLYRSMPASYRTPGYSIGEAVARYLQESRGVATLPGAVYGERGAASLRLALCGSQQVFEAALDRLRSIRSQRWHGPWERAA
ncbi:pyridoxal phosphate-dependent aminotransferase [Chitinimonas lacunae]|uniref:Aminotransferase n=1 Tax=Chitinimonas lacunae TaxID=1963018 RepID=A0ABV8MMG3_9NEIS